MSGAQLAVRETRLLEAARNNDLARVANLLKDGDLKGAQDPQGYSAIHWAILNRNIKMLGQLLLSLDKSARTLTDRGECKPIVLAAKEGDWRSVLKFAEYEAIPGAGYDIALLYAVKANQTQVVTALLQNGARGDARSETLQRTALHYAVENRNATIIKALLEYEADQTLEDVDLDNPLQLAVKRQHWQCVIALAKHPLESNRLLYSQALLAAVRQNQYHAAKALLEAGADPNFQVEGDKKTALHWAAVNNNPELVALLIRYHAELDMKDSDNHTATHIAILEENSRLLSWLLYFDEEKDLESSSSKQAGLLQWAATQRKSETLPYFRVARVTPERPRAIEVLIGASDINRIKSENQQLDFTTRLSNGLHPLSYAVELNNLEVVKTLLSYLDEAHESRKTAFDIAVSKNRWECAKAIDPERALVAYLDTFYYKRLSFFSCQNKQVKNDLMRQANTCLLENPALEQERVWSLLAESKTAKYHQFKFWSSEETRTVKACKSKLTTGMVA